VSANTGPGSGPARAAHWLKAPGILLAFVLATVWLLYPLSTSPATTLYQARTFDGWFLNQPDVMLNAWILAWDTHAVSTGKFSSFFNANIFYPEPMALSFSEHLLGVVPLFAPLYLATGNLALSLNLWIMSTFVFSGLAMYWVGLRWLGSHMAAAVAAITYAFAPWRFLELTHVQSLSVQYLPLLMYLIIRSGERRDSVVWFSIFGLTAVQSLSSYYLGYMAFMVAGAVGGASLLLQPGARVKRLLFVGSALVGAALVMIPFSLPYLELANTGAFGMKLGVPKGWLVSIGYLFPRLPDRSLDPWFVWTLVPGLAVGGAVLGMATRRYRLMLVGVVLAGIVGFWIGMTWKASLWGIRIGAIDDLALKLIPGWSAVRVVDRFTIVSWLAISVLAAVPFGRDVRWLRSFRTSRQVVGLVLIAGLLVSAASLTIRTEPSPEIATDLTPYHWLADHGEGDPLLEWPMRFADLTTRYMYLSTLHWLPLVNGYSGYKPPFAELMNSLGNGLPEPEAVRSLIKLNATRWLLIHLKTSYGLRPWGQLSQEGARLVAEGEDFQLYELPYRRDQPPVLLDGKGPDVSIFGVERKPLTSCDLQAEVTPLRKSVFDRHRMGLPVPWRIRNLSSVTWPGVAVTETDLVGVVFRVREVGKLDYQVLPGFNRLTTDLAPGQATTVWSIIRGPTKPGSYELIPCLTQAGRDVTRCFDAATIDLHVSGQ